MKACSSLNPACEQQMCEQEPVPLNTTSGDSPEKQMRRARMAARLQGDLAINLAGVALALQLLDEIEELRERLEAIRTIAHND